METKNTIANNNNNLNNNNSNSNNKGKSTPVTGTASNKFNLDHVYCHTSETNFVDRTNSTNSGGHHQPDLMALLKENKQLKAMLLLHLDLIQEQSDQLIAKDKILLAMKEENEVLKQKIQKYEKSTSINFSNRKTAPSTTTKSTSSPGLQTIEEKKENLSEFSNNIETDVQNKKLLKKESNSTKRVTRSTPSSPAELLSDDETKYKICDENYESGSTNIIGKSNGKLISKIILHRVSIPESMISSCSYKNIEAEQKPPVQQIAKIKSRSPLLRSSTKKSPQYYGKPAGGGKPTSLLLQAATRLKSPSPIEIKTEEIEDTFSCGSSGQEFNESNVNESNTHNLRKISSCSSATPGPSYSSPMATRKRRNRKKTDGYLTTKRMYPCREWLEDECPLEELLNKEEEEALKADKPMLEVPKWTVKEFTGLYSIEGTEDLSDDMFLRRHSKLEHDEKRRKKWDVQRIREIRTIERLKRRHCKDEIQSQQEHEEVLSFYPMAEDVKFIQVTEELPVHAFGEQILKVVPNDQYKLPWSVDWQKTQSLLNSDCNKLHNSHFILKKKRRRQQSGTSGTPIKRQKVGVNLSSNDNVMLDTINQK